jgi:hypothetical protein
MLKLKMLHKVPKNRIHRSLQQNVKIKNVPQKVPKQKMS